jgi:hypothetical protein
MEVQGVVLAGNVRLRQEGEAMGKRWPPEDVFAIKDLATLSKVQTANGEWIGVYRPGYGDSLLGASRSPRALARRLKGLTLCWPLHVRRAPSKEALPLKIEPAKPDHFASLRRGASEAVAYAQKIKRNSWGLYSEAEVRRATDFLHDLGNDCRSQGKSRGDKTRPGENRRMLGIFLRLDRGESLKDIAVDVGGPEKYEKTLRSLSVLTKRFSKKVHDAIVSRFGGPAESFFGPSAPRYLSRFFASVKKWPGVTFDSLDDGRALREALRRYKPSKSGQAKVKPWGSASQAIQ